MSENNTTPETQEAPVQNPVPAPAAAPVPAPVPEITFDAADIDKNRWIAIFVFIMPFFFFIPMMMDDRRDSEYVKFYVNQIFLYMIFFAACAVVNIIPFLGWLAYAAATIFLFVNWIISLVNAIKGKARRFPIFGGINLVK